MSAASRLANGARSVNGSRIDWIHALPTSILFGLSVGATLSFGGVLADWTFLVQSSVGAAGALTIAWISSKKNLLLGESLALSIAAFVVVGVICTAGVPTPLNIAGFFSGLVNGWADLLSVSPPADPTAELRVLPFTVAWLGALLGGEMLRSTRWPGLAASGPLLAMVVALLFSIETSGLPLVQGMVMIAGTMSLAVVQEHLSGERLETAEPDGAEPGARRGLLAGVLLAALAAGLAPVLGPRLPFVDEAERFDLRQLQVAPWDALSAPSPLVELKASLKSNRVDDVVFTVNSGQLVDRWPVAVLNSYNGVVWAVADAEIGGNAAFRPTDTRLPEILDAPVATGQNVVEHSITIGSLGEHWLPTAGVPTMVESDMALRINQRTGTMASPQRLSEGQTYQVASVLRPTLSVPELGLAQIVVDPGSAELVSLPAAITNLAADVTAGLPAGASQAEAITGLLSASGFYDAGDDAPPGHSFSRIVSFVDLEGQIKGFEEQYAAAAAVLLRASDIPARVVVGYVIAPNRRTEMPIAVRAGDIAAWVEVKTADGWASVDVTPNRTREPTDQEDGRGSQDTLVAEPPPDTPPRPDTDPLIEDESSDQQQPDDEPEPDEPDSDDEIREPETGGGLVRAVLVAAAAVFAPLLLIGLALACIVALKVRRERRRRLAPYAGARIAGAWAELHDRLEEAGLPAVDRGAPREAIVEIIEVGDSALVGAEAELIALTDHVDRAAFHPLPPADAEADAAWGVVDSTVKAILRDRTLWQRVRMLASARVMLRRDPVAARAPETSDERDHIIDLTDGDGPNPLAKPDRSFVDA